MKTLQLNFENITNANIKKMVDELREASPVNFTHSVGEPDMRDVMTKPEYMHITVQVNFRFDDEAEAKQFMSTPKCRDIYNTYAIPQ